MSVPVPLAATERRRVAVPAWFSRRTDLLVACALWALGFSAGSAYMITFNRMGETADFGQPEFGAAVAMACGRGFVNPGYAPTAGLARFLARESDTFSCGELPATGSPRGERDAPVSPMSADALNVTQRLYRYLMSAVAVTWALRGISWSGLWPLFGVMFGCTIAAAYGLFRVGIGRPLSIIASLALAMSAIHLSRLPYLRDYAKAPFMLALFFVMARMATGSIAPRRIIGCALLFGAILGVGFGFRNDLLINIPPFLALVLLGLPGGILANGRLKAAALAAAAAAFLVFAWPIVRAYEGGSNTGHVAFLGLMTTFDMPLGIRGTLYDWGYRYVDQFAADIINSHSYRLHGRFVEYLSKQYDREAVACLLEIVRHWPADILARVYASVLKVVELPFTVGTYANAMPVGVSGTRLAGVYDWQIWLLFHYLSGRGLLLTVLALIAIGARTPWTAAALLASLIYYAGYPAIQFDVRHFFHLEFIGWWVLACVLQQGISLGVKLGRRPESLKAFIQSTPWASLARTAVFPLAAAAVVLGTLTTLRAYQTRHVRELLGQYLAAPRQGLPTKVTERGGKSFITSPGLWDPLPGESGSMPVRARYLVAELSPAACDAMQLPVTFSYWYEDKTSDFSRGLVLKLMPHGGPTRIFFPAYCDRSWSSLEGSRGSYFEGIELPSGFAGCMTALYRSAELERFPLLLDLTLAPGWEQTRPFQTLTALERPDTGNGPTFYTVPREMVLTRAAFEHGIQSISADAADRARIATVAGDGVWTARGRPDGPQSMLVRFRPRPVQRHDVMIAEGELRTGGVSFALLAGGQKRVSASVTAPGPFVVALEAPDQGEFAVAVAANIEAWWPASRIGHRVGPLVEWIPGATLRTDVAVKRIGWSTLNPAAALAAHRE